MSPEKKFDLGDYVEVKDRIKLFYELFGQGRLVTGEVRLTNEPDGVPRVMVQGLAYRSPEDLHPGVGWSWMALPGTTSYTKGSELENTETSAWGRAIAALGILVDRSIASAQEVQNKSEAQGAGPTTVYSLGRRRLAPDGDGSLIGTAELAKDFADFLPRQGPDGMVLAFKLVSPAGGIKVIAHGSLAEALPIVKDEVIGARVSCWGRIRDETWRPKNAKKDITYQVLDLERIKAPTFTLPAFSAVPEEPLEEPPADFELFGEEPVR